jgi:hypothetical protein
MQGGIRRKRRHARLKRSQQQKEETGGVEGMKDRRILLKLGIGKAERK